MRTLRLVHSNTWFEHSNTGSPTAHDTGDRPASPLPRRGERDPALRALDPSVQAMVEHVRIVAPLPQVIGARALARARAAIAAQHR